MVRGSFLGSFWFAPKVYRRTPLLIHYSRYIGKVTFKIYTLFCNTLSINEGILVPNAKEQLRLTVACQEM
jgi:hypothetical protein